MGHVLSTIYFQNPLLAGPLPQVVYDVTLLRQKPQHARANVVSMRVERVVSIGRGCNLAGTGLLIACDFEHGAPARVGRRPRQFRQHGLAV